jgi:transcriptional regulator with XRE-family HTH domain
LERFTGTMRTEIYSEEHQKLRKILRRERLAAGLRQSDLAERTGRSQAYVSKFEKGDLRLDVVDFMRICDVIGCDVVDVMAETFGRQKVVKMSVNPDADVKIELRSSPPDVKPRTVIVANEPSIEPLGTESKSNQRSKKH